MSMPQLGGCQDNSVFEFDRIPTFFGLLTWTGVSSSSQFLPLCVLEKIGRDNWHKGHGPDVLPDNHPTLPNHWRNSRHWPQPVNITHWPHPLLSHCRIRLWTTIPKV